MTNKTYKNLDMLKYLLGLYYDLVVIKENDIHDNFVEMLWNEITSLFSKLQGDLNE